MAIKHLIEELEQWTTVYNFSFQFWGPANYNVFISKDNIDLADFGGEDTVEDIIKIALEWAKQQNPNGLPTKTYNHCQSCGARIAFGNDYCGECLCEDDGI